VLSKRAAHKLEMQKKWQARKEAKQKAKLKKQEARQQQRQQEGGEGEGKAEGGEAAARPAAAQDAKTAKKAKKAKKAEQQGPAGAEAGGHPPGAEVDISAWRAFALHPQLEDALRQLVRERVTYPSACMGREAQLPGAGRAPFWPDHSGKAVSARSFRCMHHCKASPGANVLSGVPPRALCALRRRPRIVLFASVLGDIRVMCAAEPCVMSSPLLAWLVITQHTPPLADGRRWMAAARLLWLVRPAW